MIYTTISLVGRCTSKLMCVRGGLGKSAVPQHISFMGLQMKTQKIIPKTQMLSPVLEPLPEYADQDVASMENVEHMEVSLDGTWQLQLSRKPVIIAVSPYRN